MTEKTLTEKVKDFPKKRRGYYYVKDGDVEVAYPSVTTILNVLNKPALAVWAIQQTTRVIADNPSLILNEKNVMSAVYGVRDSAAERGKTVHSMLEVLKNGNKLQMDTIPTHLKGYARALVSWWETTKPDVLFLEKEIISKKHGYAGSADMVCIINNKKWLIDLKTSKDGAIYKEAHLQVSAYRQALKEMGYEVDFIGIVSLSDDGTFNFKESEDRIELFLHVKAVWEGMNDK